jgi:peptide/nickel transport system substrate-binding protein
MEKMQNEGKPKKTAKKVVKKRVALNRKQIIAVGVISIVAIAGIGGGVVIYLNMPKGGDLIVPLGEFPLFIDPHYYFGGLISKQVVEGLFDIDTTDPDNKNIPALATSSDWSDNNLELTCTLRQGITFHDGTEFNAQAVKWNFDRLYGLIDQIPSAYLWLHSDGRWIISETQVIDDYTVKFVLEEPYAPLIALLSSTHAPILSPSSTPQDAPIDAETENLVGTGPFIYNHSNNEPGVEVRMSPNLYYWDGKPAIDNLVFSIIPDWDARFEALSTGDINLVLLPAMADAFNDISIKNALERFQANSSFILAEGPQQTRFRYIGMNNKIIPVEMRKALAYAFDYEYVLDEYFQGWANRMKSPIHKGIMYSNIEDFDVPELNLEIARRSLQDANWPGTVGLPLDEDEPWEALVDNNTPIATYNFTYGIDNPAPWRHLNLALVAQENFKKIGVKLECIGKTFVEMIFMLYEMGGYHRNMVEIFPWGWIIDYNDPANIVNYLMSNQSPDNVAQIDDAQLQAWMEQAVKETDPVARELLYYNIQERFIEELYPWILFIVPRHFDLHVANLRGFTPNFMKTEFKNAYFV